MIFSGIHPEIQRALAQCKKLSPEEWMSAALLPFTEDGAIIPFLFVGCEDGKVTYYPVHRVGLHGHCPMWAEADFADGRTPPDLIYASGHIVPGANGELLTLYDDAVFNLPAQQQMDLLLLQQIMHFAQRQPLPPRYSLPPCPQNLPPAQFLPSPLGLPQQGGIPNESEVFIDRTGSFSYYDGKNAQRIANFSFEVRELHVIKEHNEPDAQEVLLEIFCSESLGYFAISCDRLEQLVPEIKIAFPICHLTKPSNSWESLITNYCRDHLKSAPRRTIIQSTGFWYLNGRHVYAHDNAPEIDPWLIWKTGRSIPNTVAQPESAREFIYFADNISSKPTLALPLCLLAHLGPMFTLFDEAGFPPRFVTLLVGKTGSLKTALSTTLFRLFEEEPTSPECTFRDTPNAIQLGLCGARDRVFLVDDFQPPVSASSGKANLEKLEQILRLSGDNIGKARATSRLTVEEGSRPAACCLVTGEDLGGSESSLFRGLILNVEKDDIDGEVLRHFQDHPDLLQSHFCYFLIWAGCNYEEIVKAIPSIFSAARQYFNGYLHEKRLIDAGALLLCTAYLLERYLLGANPINIDSGFTSRCSACLLQVLRQSEASSRKRDPVKMYVQALMDLRTEGRINLATSQDQFRRGVHTGFVKEGCWYLLPHPAYNEVASYWQKLGTKFPLTYDRIHAALASAHLIALNNKDSHFWKSTLPDRPSFLVIDPNRAQNYINTVD